MRVWMFCRRNFAVALAVSLAGCAAAPEEEEGKGVSTDAVTESAGSEPEVEPVAIGELLCAEASSSVWYEDNADDEIDRIYPYAKLRCQRDNPGVKCERYSSGKLPGKVSGAWVSVLSCPPRDP